MSNIVPSPHPQGIDRAVATPAGLFNTSSKPASSNAAMMRFQLRADDVDSDNGTRGSGSDAELEDADSDVAETFRPLRPSFFDNILLNRTQSANVLKRKSSTPIQQPSDTGLEKPEETVLKKHKRMGSWGRPESPLNHTNLRNHPLLPGAGSVFMPLPERTYETTRALVAEERPSSSRDTDCEKALAAWKDMFGDRQASLGPADAVPFQASRHLGRGGGGSVDETKIGGITVAWKRISTRARRLTNEEMNEVKILSEISKRRHRHIVELIGSYTHRYKGGIELGMLIWPVAHCDLAHFLQDIDYLGDSLTQRETITVSLEDLESVVDNLFPLISGKMSTEGRLQNFNYQFLLYGHALNFLRQKIGCIGEAVAYLHRHGIRHKDLKPAQVLLAANGLWLTDFGWSKDISQLTNSVTNGGDRITLRYHAPERSAGGDCGKPEDIFALGCIYLEIGYRLTRWNPLDKDFSLPWANKPFFANLERLNSWMIPFDECSYGTRELGQLITRMLATEPKSRPTIDGVVRSLSNIVFSFLDTLPYFLTQSSTPIVHSFFGHCCQPTSKTMVPDANRASRYQNAQRIRHSETIQRTPNARIPDLLLSNSPGMPDIDLVDKLQFGDWRDHDGRQSKARVLAALPSTIWSRPTSPDYVELGRRLIDGA